MVTSTRNIIVGVGVILTLGTLWIGLDAWSTRPLKVIERDVRAKLDANLIPGLTIAEAQKRLAPLSLGMHFQVWDEKELIGVDRIQGYLFQHPGALRFIPAPEDAIVKATFDFEQGRLARWRVEIVPVL